RLPRQGAGRRRRWARPDLGAPLPPRSPAKALTGTTPACRCKRAAGGDDGGGAGRSGAGTPPNSLAEDAPAAIGRRLVGGAGEGGVRRRLPTPAGRRPARPEVTPGKAHSCGC